MAEIEMHCDLIETLVKIGNELVSYFAFFFIQQKFVENFDGESVASETVDAALDFGVRALADGGTQIILFDGFIHK